MPRLAEIVYCNQCSDHERLGHGWPWCHKKRKYLDSHSCCDFPKWCPLPEVPQQVNAPDAEVVPVLEGPEYGIEYVDAHTIRLARRR